jgi:phosphatidylserine/phosphatidylglycerophosphate/cardiolipin synthase-like enzyme
MQTFKYRGYFRFPWRDEQHFDLLVDGGKYFPAMLQSIDDAQQYIYLEMYLIQSGQTASRFIDHLIQASQRGVAVKILLDHYGSYALTEKDRQRLSSNHISLQFYNPLRYGALRKNLFRDHRKLLLIDGILAYTGGAGITDNFDPRCRPDDYWHEAIVRIQGSCVQDWKLLFEANWGRHDHYIEPQLETVRQISDFESHGRVVEGRTIRSSGIIGSIIMHMRDARKHIWLSSPYFVPSRSIIRTLIRQARKGVDVRLLLPGPNIDHQWARHMGHYYYERLLVNGVRIFEYQPRFTHMKLLYCDQWVSIGSTNLDRWNFRWNLEANQEIDDPQFALDVHQTFEQDFEDSHEIDPLEWRSRSWITRLKIEFWTFIAKTIDWLSADDNKP